MPDSKDKADQIALFRYGLIAPLVLRHGTASPVNPIAVF